MNSRQKIAALVAAEKNGTPPPAEACLGATLARGRERNLRANDDHGFSGRSHHDTMRPRVLFFDAATQAALHESLKAKKSTAYSPGPQTGVVVNILDEATVLFERYGDVMGVIDHHPLCRRATAPVEEGGWGLWPQSLTNACKQHSIEGDLATGLLKVMSTLRFVANYPAARNKGRFFFAALKNGTRQEI